MGHTVTLMPKSVVGVSGLLAAHTALPYGGIFQEVFFMKNTIKMFGIIVLVAIIGFSFAACGGTSSPADPPSGNGSVGSAPPGPPGLPGQSGRGCGCDGYLQGSSALYFLNTPQQVSAVGLGLQ